MLKQYISTAASLTRWIGSAFTKPLPRRTIVLIVGALICFGFWVLVYNMRYLRHRAWVVGSEFEGRSLATQVRAYHSEQGRYPSNLVEIVASADAETKIYLMKEFIDSNAFIFDYQHSDKSFTITIRNRPRWPDKREVYQKTFREEDFLISP